MDHAVSLLKHLPSNLVVPYSIVVQVLSRGPYAAEMQQRLRTLSGKSGIPTYLPHIDLVAVLTYCAGGLSTAQVANLYDHFQSYLDVYVSQQTALLRRVAMGYVTRRKLRSHDLIRRYKFSYEEKVLRTFWAAYRDRYRMGRLWSVLHRRTRSAVPNVAALQARSQSLSSSRVVVPGGAGSYGPQVSRTVSFSMSEPSSTTSSFSDPMATYPPRPIPRSPSRRSASSAKRLDTDRRISPAKFVDPVLPAPDLSRSSATSSISDSGGALERHRIRQNCTTTHPSPMQTPDTCPPSNTRLDIAPTVKDTSSKQGVVYTAAPPHPIKQQARQRRLLDPVEQYYLLEKELEEERRQRLQRSKYWEG